MKHARWWLTTGAVCGFLTVALGAFGAHGLKGRVEPDMIANWRTAADYLGMHGSAILAAGLLLTWRPDARLIHFAAWCFLIGASLFCGSLFVMVLSGERLLGVITPVGGITLLAGWALLAVGAWRAGSEPR